MRITIEHTLSVTMPPGASQAVFHLLLTPASGPSQTVESWSVEMAGIGNAGRFADGFGNTAHLVNQPKPEGEITIQVRGVVTTRDTHGVLGRPTGEPVPGLYRRITALTKAPEALHEGLKDGKASRLDCLHALMHRVGEQLGMPDDEEDEDEPATQTQMQVLAVNHRANHRASRRRMSPPRNPARPPSTMRISSSLRRGRSISRPAS